MDAWIGAATDAVVEERRRVYLVEQVRVRSAIESLGGGRASGCRSGHATAAGAAGRLAPRLRHRSSTGRSPSSGESWTASCTCSRGKSEANGCCDTRRAPGTVHLWVTTDQRAADTAGGGSPRAGAASRRHRRTAPRSRRISANVSRSIRCTAAGRQSGRTAAESRTSTPRWRSSSAGTRNAPAGSSSTSFEISPADSPEMADMRNTLRTFFDTRMRIAPAAERLFLHRNTLINRLERIQSMLGHSVDRTDGRDPSGARARGTLRLT